MCGPDCTLLWFEATLGLINSVEGHVKLGEVLLPYRVDITPNVLVHYLTTKTQNVRCHGCSHLL